MLTLKRYYNGPCGRDGPAGAMLLQPAAKVLVPRVAMQYRNLAPSLNQGRTEDPARAAGVAEQVLLFLFGVSPSLTVTSKRPGRTANGRVGGGENSKIEKGKEFRRFFHVDGWGHNRRDQRGEPCKEAYDAAPIQVVLSPVSIARAAS